MGLLTLKKVISNQVKAVAAGVGRRKKLMKLAGRVVGDGVFDSHQDGNIGDV